MPTRPVPSHPSLELDREQARALLDAAHHGDAGAVERFRAHHPRFRSATAEQVRAAALHDAQLVVAREYGFGSWPRWKQFVETRRLDAGERAAELVRAACSGDMRKASMLLGAEPALETFDLHTACVCGASEHVERLLQRDASLATRAGGPLGRAPILDACFSRFLRSDAGRAAGIVRVVRLLLDHGADANAHFFLQEGAERWIQTCLYAAAGIANNAELTRMLLSAGADVNELLGDPGDDVSAGGFGPEALYHASELADVTCLRLMLEASPPPHPKRISYCLARMLDFENPAGVELFLRHGADSNFRIPWMHHRTHLHRAIVYGRGLAIVRMLVDAGGDPDAADDLGMTPLRSAVQHGREDVVALLRAAGADDGRVTPDDLVAGAVARGQGAPGQTPRLDPDLLCYAAMRNEVEVIRRLLNAAPTRTPSEVSTTRLRFTGPAGAAATRPPGSWSKPAPTSVRSTDMAGWRSTRRCTDR